MSETLPVFLKRRAERSYRYLQEQIQGLTPEEALQHRRQHWQDHKWGLGQDGSIAGIVYHVAAWKQMTLPIFASGGQPLLREEFDAGAAPAGDDWPGIADWLTQVGRAWSAELAALPEAAFDEMREWEGHPMPLAAFVVEMVEHDIQHAAQIEYLRQELAAHAKEKENIR